MHMPLTCPLAELDCCCDSLHNRCKLPIHISNACIFLSKPIFRLALLHHRIAIFKEFFYNDKKFL